VLRTRTVNDHNRVSHDLTREDGVKTNNRVPSNSLINNDQVKGDGDNNLSDKVNNNLVNNKVKADGDNNLANKDLDNNDQVKADGDNNLVNKDLDNSNQVKAVGDKVAINAQAAKRHKVQTDNLTLEINPSENN